MAQRDGSRVGKKLTGALKFYLDNAGKDLGWLAKIKASGANTPTLDRTPVIPCRQRWLWDAWGILSGRRIENESGPQPIQISEIKALAEMYDLGAGMAAELLDVILALDVVYTSHIAQARAKAARRGPRGAKPRPGEKQPAKKRERVPIGPQRR